MKKQKMNLPNKITLFRVVDVIVIIGLYLLKDLLAPGSVRDFTIMGLTYNWIDLSVLGLFILGVWSDHLDGHIARKNNIITTFGKFLDPIADKLLVNTLFIILTYFGRIHWIVTVIMVGRDLVVDVIRLIMVEKKVVIAASNLGKLKTVAQMLALILVLALPFTGGLFFYIINGFVYLSALISLISGVDYFMKSKKFLLEDMKS